MASWITGLFLGLCSIKDLKHKEISVRVTAIFCVLGIIYRLSGGSAAVKQAVFGMILGAVVLGVGYLTSEAIGYGDGLAVGILGIWLGFWQTFEILFLALFLSACAAAIVIVIKRPGRKYRIPFVPFLLMGWIFWVLTGMKQVM